MDYHAPIKGLIREARLGVRFKNMSPVVKIIVKILLIPFIIITFFSIAYYYITLFFFKAFASPIQYLHNIIKNEAKEVKHASQFAIYWLTFPYIFALYVIQSFTAFSFFFLWFGCMLNTYIVTLGGVKFQPFLLDVKYSEE